MKLESSDFEASVERVSDISVKIKVSVKNEAVQSSFKEKLSTLTKRIKINGFRPGKVPKSMVEKLHGQELRFEAIDEVINQSLRSVAGDNKLDIVGQPKVEIVKSEVGADIEYSAEAELFPQPEVKEYDQFKVQVPGEEIGDKEVENSLLHLRKMKATNHPVTDRDVAQTDDLVDLEVSMAHGDEKFNRPEPTVLVIGEATLPKQVEDALVGCKLGESIDVEVPHKHGEHEHLDKYHVKLKSISQRVLPEPNDEFAVSLGFEEKTILELRNKIRESLEGRRKAEVEEAARAKMLEQLLERNQFEVPQGLVDQEIKSMLLRMNSGQNDLIAKPEFSVEAFREGLGEVAAKRVRSAILVDRIVSVEKLTPSDTEINQAIADLAKQHGASVEEVARYVKQQGQYSPFILELVRGKAIELLMQRTQIEYVAPEVNAA